MDTEFDRYTQALNAPVWLMSEQEFDGFGELLSGSMEVAVAMGRQPKKAS